MRRAWISVAAVLLLILALEACSRMVVTDTSRSMCAHVYALEQAARRGDTEEARSCCRALRAHWVTVRARLHLFFEHEYVDRADALLSRLEPMIARGGWDELLPSLTELTAVLESFPESLRITLTNIC